MSMRRAVLAAASLLVLALLASPAAAHKAPSPKKQVDRAFSLLVRDTQKLPKPGATR